MLVKYSRGGTACAATEAKGDIVVVTGDEWTAIFDQNSGELIHELKVLGSAVCLSKDGKTLFLGNNAGTISKYDVSTGVLENAVDIFEEVSFLLLVTLSYVIPSSTIISCSYFIHDSVVTSDHFGKA